MMKNDDVKVDASREGAEAQSENKYGSASLKGRAEALEIILSLDAESSLDDYIRSYPCGDSGEYSAAWDVEKLRKLFRVGKEMKRSPFGQLAEAAEEMYWKNMAERDYFDTFKELVRRLVVEIEAGQINRKGFCNLELIKTWITPRFASAPSLEGSRIPEAGKS